MGGAFEECGVGLRPRRCPGCLGVKGLSDEVAQETREIRLPGADRSND